MASGGDTAVWSQHTTMPRSAARNRSRPAFTTIGRPTSVRITPGVAAVTEYSYLGSPSALRSQPKISAVTPRPKVETPS